MFKVMLQTLLGDRSSKITCQTFAAVVLGSYPRPLWSYFVVRTLLLLPSACCFEGYRVFRLSFGVVYKNQAARDAVVFCKTCKLSNTWVADCFERILYACLWVICVTTVRRHREFCLVEHSLISS